MLLVLLVTLAGCIENYGKIRPNPSLVEAYKTRQLLPEYQYYYCGRSRLPYAVIGIDPKYKFPDRLWYKIKTKEDVYNKIYKLMQTPWESPGVTAADILDSSGHKIGIWFSYYSTTVVKIVPETNIIEVQNPYNPNYNEQF
jgi:hypothetical protein